MTTRDFDLVLFGATGFTGRLVAERLTSLAPEGARIALAGRSQTKLEAVRAALPERGREWPILLADSGDPDALQRLAASAVAVITTVGPYAKYGMPLATACAENGTHYVDLTGEVLFMRESIDTLHEVAKASGARIVHACGFDSIPSDLGVLMLHDALGQLGPTTYVVRSMAGGASGGTIASGMGQAEAMKDDPSLRKIAADPFALSPDRGAETAVESSDVVLPTHDAELGWLAPFFMAPVNTRVVRRSNALLGHAYGSAFTYREVSGFGEGVVAGAKATLMAAGLGGMWLGMAVPPLRMLAGKFLPAPGEGPDEKSRESGHFTIHIHTTDSLSRKWRGVVGAQGDPGYAATSLMLAEAGLCAAFDGERLTSGGGVLTPATAFGMTLVHRLRSRGMTFAVEEV